METIVNELIASWINGNRKYVAYALLSYHEKYIANFCCELVKQHGADELFVFSSYFNQIHS